MLEYDNIITMKKETLKKNLWIVLGFLSAYFSIFKNGKIYGFSFYDLWPGISALFLVGGWSVVRLFFKTCSKSYFIIALFLFILIFYAWYLDRAYSPTQLIAITAFSFYASKIIRKKGR